MVGSIIHGTHRGEDLVPAFFRALDELDPARAEVIAEEYHVELAWCMEHEGKPVNGPEPEGVEYLIEALLDALNDCAPEGYYFGAHPGDGSDFGFWPLEEEAEDVEVFCVEF